MRYDPINDTCFAFPILFSLFSTSNHISQEKFWDFFSLIWFLTHIVARTWSQETKADNLLFFSRFVANIAMTCSSLRANSHERASRFCSKIRRPTALFDRTARAILREFVGLSVSMWSGNHDEWLTQAMSSALLLREAYCAACAALHRSLHSFLILLISHPCLLVPSTINSRSFRPRFNDRLDWERGGQLRKAASKQRPFRANFNLLINLSKSLF